MARSTGWAMKRTSIDRKDNLRMESGHPRQRLSLICLKSCPVVDRSIFLRGLLVSVLSDRSVDTIKQDTPLANINALARTVNRYGGHGNR